MVRFNLEVNKLKISGLSPQELGAEPAGAAAAARLDAIQHSEQRFSTLAEAIGNLSRQTTGDPAGSAAVAEQNAIAFSRQAVADLALTIPRSPDQIGAEVAGAAAAARQSAVQFAQQAVADLSKTIPNSPQQIGAEVAGAAATAQQNAIAFTQQKINELAAVIEGLYPNTAFVPWGYGRVVVGGAFGLGGVSTNIFLNRFAVQSPAALNDEVEVTFLLRAGNYRLDLWGLRNNQQGIIQLFLNDVALGAEIDRYAMSATPFISSFTVNIPSTKIQKFRTKVTGKNASSVGFQVWTSALLLYPV
jgi:hypothetical protein